MGSRKVRIEIKILDTSPEATMETIVLGSASADAVIPDDLLQGSGAFVTGAQDFYDQLVGGVGVAAYRQAFPRRGPHAEEG
jgi:hypothetical protein